MAELGTKHECYSCGAKFYDFGRPAPICPKCGANQKDVKRPDTAAEAQAKRKKREDLPKAIVEPEDDLVVAPDEDIPDDEIEAPEGVVEEEEDFDDDEE